MVTIAKKICNEKPKVLSSAYGSPCKQFVMSLLTKDIAIRPSMIELLGTPFIVANADKVPKPSSPAPSRKIAEPEIPTPSRAETGTKKIRFLKDRDASPPKAGGAWDTARKTKDRGGGGGGNGSAGGSKKKTVDILKRFTTLKAKVNKDKLFSEEPRTPVRSPEANRAPTPGSPALYAKGNEVLYTRTGETVAIGSVHLDDPEGGTYYTIIMPDGRDKQTLETALQPLKNQLALYPESEEEDDWESAFSPQGFAMMEQDDHDDSVEMTAEEAMGAFFPMPGSDLGGAGFELNEDYVDDFSSPSPWGMASDGQDDVVAGAMTNDQARKMAEAGDELTLEQLRELGRHRVKEVRQQGASLEWIHVNEALSKAKIVRTIVKKIREEDRLKAALVCKPWYSLVRRLSGKKSGLKGKSSQAESLGVGIAMEAEKDQNDKQGVGCACIIS